jgi:hypothetical protein
LYGYFLDQQLGQSLWNNSDRSLAIQSHVKSVSDRSPLAISNELQQILNHDRSKGGKFVRVIKAILANAALLLLCLTVVGIAITAPLFCRQKRRKGNNPWFFSETKTSTKFRIAQQNTERAFLCAG